MNNDRSPKTIPYGIILLSAFFFGHFGIHDFLMKRYFYGFVHLIAFVIAYISILITGNILLMVVTLPANYVLGLVEAFVYGNDGPKIISKEVISDNTSADEKMEKEAKKADLDRQLAEGRIDGKEYNKQIIELVVLDERKKPITKTRRVTIILRIFSFLNIFFVISGLYTGSKSDSDGYLPEGMAIFIFAPLAIVFTICAIISSTKQK
jgi:hypothetical protein